MDNYNIYNNKHKKNSESYLYTGGIKWSFSLIKDLLKNINVNDIKDIIDVGCGEGGKANLLSSYFTNSKVLGIDFTDEGIKLANEHYSNTNLEFKKLNVMDIDEKEKRYDLVTSFEVLEHIEDWQTLLKKMIDISDKYILISVPTGRMRDYEVHIGHLRNFKKLQIEEFMNNNGFRTVKTFYAGFPFYSPLGRDWLNKNFKGYEEDVAGEFTFKQKVFHKLLYIMFRYFCLKNVGDAFYGLFENITINSKWGGGKL